MKEQGKTTVRPLRKDLDIVPVRPDDEGETSYLLRDPVSGKVFDFSERERLTLTLLDGTFSLATLRNVMSSHDRFSGDSLPTVDELAVFINQLAAEGLLEGSDALKGMQPRRGRWHLFRRAVTLPIRAFLRWFVIFPWDFLSLGSRSDTIRPKRVRLGNPDPLLAILARRLRPVFGRTALVVTAAISLLGFGLLIANFGDWWDGVRFLWNPWGLVVLTVTGVLVVHIPHQLAHGAVLVHYGGRVPGWGLRFLFHLVPTLWLDVSDFLWLRERRHRLAVIGVGLLWQLVTFSAGIVGWLVSDRGTSVSVFFFALSTTAFFGFVLNANPFSRRDLYQLLSAWLDMPDLRLRAREYLRAWTRWRPVPEPLSVTERRWIGVYGVAVNVFGLVITGAAVALALRMIRDHGENGAIGVLFASAVVFQDHARTFFDQPWWRRLVGRTPRVLRWVLGMVMLIGIIWVLFLPYPYQAGGDTELLPRRMAEIRTELEGLIGEVFVTEGEWVAQGQPVAALLERVQQRNLNAAEANLAEAQARRSLLLAGNRPEEIQRARTALRTAQTKAIWSAARAERYEQLFKDQVVGLQQYEDALQLKRVDESQLEEAKAYLQRLEVGARAESVEALDAEIRSQEAIVDHFKDDLVRTVLVSPIDGQVTTPRIEQLQGRYLKPGQRDLVATIEDTRVLIAEIEVPEEDIEGVAIGNEVTLYTRSYPEQAFRGSVTGVAPVALDDDLKESKVVRVVTEIPNPGGVLKPEMTGFAKIEVEDRPVWDVLFRPFLRWLRIEVWSWIP